MSFLLSKYDMHEVVFVLFYKGNFGYQRERCVTIEIQEGGLW
jgi:hypothetical protein